MDNRVFNVNGKTKEQLKLALQSLLMDEYGKPQKVKGWYFRPDKGFILTWYTGDSNKATPFTNRMGVPEEIGIDELIDILWDWLDSDAAKGMKLDGWDKDFDDEDVSCDPGWRLYTDDWGHVGGVGGGTDHYSIGALTKAYMWYGK